MARITARGWNSIGKTPTKSSSQHHIVKSMKVLSLKPMITDRSERELAKGECLIYTGKS